MKKLFVSVGLAAAGTVGLHAAYSPDATDTSKIWTVSGTLRGFYDDNYLTTTKKTGSAGFEVSPSFSLNAPFSQTEIGLRYVYGLYYYQDRERRGQNPTDQSHQFDLWLDHAFSPRWEARLQDTVAVAQEPQLLSNGGAVSVPQRVEGNNIANNGRVSLHTDWSDLFSTMLSYQNNFYSYQNHGAQVINATGTPAIPNLLPPPLFIPGTGSPASVNASLAGLLDRIEQYISLDFQYHLSPETLAFVGYQIGFVNYTGNELIAYSQPFPYTLPPTSFYSNSRDNLSHYGYVGLSHQFLPNLSGSFRAGLQYTTYYNDSSSQNSLGPYGDASLIYTYASGSYAQIGLTETRNATDTVTVNSAGHITLDQESTIIYGSINHPLTPKLLGSLVANYQYSLYHGGTVDGDAANLFTVGLNLSYTFTRHFSSELGYNFDWYRTATVLGQDYNRNRVYLGVTASY